MSFFSCSLNRKNTNAQEVKTEISNLYIATTIYEENNPCSLTNILYLTMIGMSRGDTWQDEQDEYFFYRLVFSSMGEHYNLDVEKIGWLSNESDHLNLVSRIRIQEKDFDNNWWYGDVPKIEWISPTVVKLSFAIAGNWEDKSEKEFILDLTKIFNQPKDID